MPFLQKALSLQQDNMQKRFGFSSLRSFVSLDRFNPLLVPKLVRSGQATPNRLDIIPGKHQDMQGYASDDEKSSASNSSFTSIHSSDSEVENVYDNNNTVSRRRSRKSGLLSLG